MDGWVEVDGRSGRIPASIFCHGVTFVTLLIEHFLGCIDITLTVLEIHLCARESEKSG